MNENVLIRKVTLGEIQKIPDKEGKKSEKKQQQTRKRLERRKLWEKNNRYYERYFRMFN